MTKSLLPRVIVVDSNFIISYITKKDTTSDDRARMDCFIEDVENAKSKIIFPMIAISEFLVRAENAGLAILDELEKKACILVANFDRAAAQELAKMERNALNAGDKRAGSEEPYQKIKVDRQIVAIGLAHGAKMIISRDVAVRNEATRLGLFAARIQDLELPQSARQLTLVAPLPTARKTNFRRPVLATAPAAVQPAASQKPD